tara:strand:- start:993 stop:1118 length:126 start_codon:yes stop_codon:yes gene_type:complete
LHSGKTGTERNIPRINDKNIEIVTKFLKKEIVHTNFDNFEK